MLKNAFTKKKINTMTLGEKIKKIRSEKRISLLDVARYTKIQLNYLEYLENSQFDKLPADVYVKGFLRSYGQFLGVDEEILVRLYEKEKGIKINVERTLNPKTKEKKQKPINVNAFVLTPKKIAITLFGLLITIGFFYLYSEIGSFTDAPRLVILSPQNNSTISVKETLIEGITDKDAKIFINDQPILVADDGKFNQNITLSGGINTINIKSINKFKKASEESITIQSNFDQNENDENAMVAGSEKERMEAETNSNIHIEVRVDPGPVWLSVESDGNLVFSGTMLSGATQNFEANDKIIINSGRANGTFIKFNGKDMGTIGNEPGAIRGVTFTKDTKY